MFLIHLQLANLGVVINVINLEEVSSQVKIIEICYDKILDITKWSRLHVTLIRSLLKTLGSTPLISLMTSIANYIVELEYLIANEPVLCTNEKVALPKSYQHLIYVYNLNTYTIQQAGNEKNTK